MDELGVDIRLETVATADVLADFDAVVIATGVTPRIPEIPGVDHPSVATYLQVLRGEVEVGQSVAILGAGGIGFDVAEYLTDTGQHTSTNVPAFFETWGVDTDYREAGLQTADPEPSPREVTLLQRKTTKVGAGLGKTTGWIHLLLPNVAW